MIYFDKNKQAYGYKIKAPLCIVDENVWKEFSTLKLGAEYNVTENGIIDLRETEEYKQKQAQKENERISKLSLTAADVERAIYKAKGMDFDDIVEFVKANPPEGLEIKALKIELKANNFYRANPYVEKIGTLLGYSSDDLDYLFINKELPENLS